MKGIPLALPERLAVAQDAIVPGCRLDAQAGGFEPANELADVLPHSKEPTVDACSRSRRLTGGPLPDRSAQSRLASSSIRSRRV